ncbi:hypothetical protein P3L10_016416 [Capsicum annuum]
MKLERKGFPCCLAMEIRPFSSTTLPGYLPLVSSDIKAGASCNSQFPVDGSLKAVTRRA